MVDNVGIDEPAQIDLRMALQAFTRGANTVHREEVTIGGIASEGDAAVASVVAADPGTGLYGLVTRPILPVADLRIGRIKITDDTTVVLVQATPAALRTAIYDPANARGASVDASNNLQVILAANSGVDVGDMDILSIVPGTGATNLGKAIDSVAGATDTGVAPLAIRDDALSALTPIEGDWTPLRVNSTGALHVTGGGGGTEYNEDDATPAPIVGTATLMERDDVIATLTPLEGDFAASRCSAEGALWTQDFNSDDMLTALQLIDDAISGSQMQVDLVGITPDLMLGTDFSNVLGTASLVSNAAIQATGDEAHDAADAGNPAKIGGRAQTSEAQPEEVADNDRVDALFDRSGYLRVRGDFDPSFADINDSTSGDNTIIAAQGAGKRIAVWEIVIVSDGTTDVRFEDGAAGTAFTGQIPLQAREGYERSAGGLVPLFVGAANTLLNLELTAAVNCHGGVSYTVMDD